MLLPLLIEIAQAGSGPWVPGTSVGNVYLGVDGEHWTRIRAITDDGSEMVDAAEGVGSVSGIAIVSYGITPRIEVEGRLPYRATHVNREDHALCQDLGAGACDATHTVGVIEARFKGLALDELSGAPISLAFGVDLRFGGLTSTTRSRLTNAGEGTTDFGPRVAVGRSGTLGSSFYGVSLDANWIYRVPNTRSFPLQTGQRVVPGSEFSGDAEFFFTPAGGVVSVGPYASALYRPSGIDLGDLVVDDPDRFGALRILHAAVGGKLLLRDGRNHVFVISAGRTVVAMNNPADRLSFGVGFSINDAFKIFERPE